MKIELLKDLIKNIDDDCEFHFEVYKGEPLVASVDLVIDVGGDDLRIQGLPAEFQN